jgi:hypothetical protein
MRVDFGIGRHFEVAIDAENLPDRHLHIGQTDGFRNFAHGGGRHQSSEVPGIPETRFAEWLRMAAGTNLAESNGRKKPAAQSKFRCLIIEIGDVSGFWRAALRITPYLFTGRPGPTLKATGPGWHFPPRWRVVRSDVSANRDTETGIL